MNLGDVSSPCDFYFGSGFVFPWSSVLISNKSSLPLPKELPDPVIIYPSSEVC